MDDFKLLPAQKRGSVPPDNVGFSVYDTKHSCCQLNIKLGTEVLDLLSCTTGDRLELRYNVGKRQVLVTKGNQGFKLRPDGSFRRNINKGWHQEPFPAKEMSLVFYEVVDLDSEKVIIQLPMKNEHD